MKRDKRQRPADSDPRAGTSEAEREERFAQLTRRRSKLSADEAALLRQMFPAIPAAHHKHVWDRLRRARFSRHDAKEFHQDVFLARYGYILEHAPPPSACYGFLVASTTIPPPSTTVIPVALPPASRLNVTRQPSVPITNSVSPTGTSSNDDGPIPW